MRTSVLNRAIVSIASLAIGSVALAAAPATADPISGTTHDLVLGAAHNARERTASNPQAELLADKACAPTADELRGQVLYEANPATDGVDGILIRAEYLDHDQASSRTCTFAAFATTSPVETLSGTASTTGTSNDIQQRGADTPLTTTTLSGDVTVTEPVKNYDGVTVAAKGAAITTTTSTTVTSRTITPKTTQQKKAAKKTRDNTVSAARKAYAKALRKAGSSRAEKAAAKQSFLARKRAADAVYRAARAGTLTVGTTTTAATAASPFDIQIQIQVNDGCRGSNARC